MKQQDWTPPGWRPGPANVAVAAGLILSAGILYAAGGRTVSVILTVLAIGIVLPAPRDPNVPLRRSAYAGPIVCAWCGDTIEEAIDARLPASHGLCDACHKSGAAD
ncbi:MAG: hypothetical protein AB7R89_33350 [Dehalococcoidia bacterium]